MLDFTGGADRDRTDDLLNAIQALSQLSYSPIRRVMEKILSLSIFNEGNVTSMPVSCQVVKAQCSNSR